MDEYPFNQQSVINIIKLTFSQHTSLITQKCRKGNSKPPVFIEDCL